MADTYREQCDCGCGDEVGDDTSELAQFYEKAAAEHSTYNSPDFAFWALYLLVIVCGVLLVWWVVF